MTGRRPEYVGYSLIGHDPIGFEDIIEWAHAYELLDKSGGRIVRQEYVNETWVSTVFLGVDHDWTRRRPLLFETMTFGTPAIEVRNRYSTWDEAVAGHERVVAEVRDLYALRDRIGDRVGPAGGSRPDVDKTTADRQPG